MIRTHLEELINKCILYDGVCTDSDIDRCLHSILQEVKGIIDGDIEGICEAVHKAYCKYHLENKGIEYWTKGDYNLLTEEGKEYDRRTVRAALSEVRNTIRKEKG